MAEALFVRALLGIQPEDFTVASAGFGPSGAPAEREVIEVMDDIGLDVTRHRSTTVDTALLAGADLVLAMTRQHVMDLALLDECAWPKSFLLGEFASLVAESSRIGRDSGTDPGDPPTSDTDDLRRRVARPHQGRGRSDLLTLPSSLEIGGPMRGYRAPRDKIAEPLVAIAAFLVS
jgi:protein-tyrosine-phosphatase